MDAPSTIRFADQIGILGKDEAVGQVRDVAAGAACGYTIDIVPAEVWDDVMKAKGDLSWAEINRRCRRPTGHNWHPYRGRLRRETVALLAEALDDDQLRWWASPDIDWDRITEIVDVGSTLRSSSSTICSS